jgi:hypothetical protein
MIKDDDNMIAHNVFIEADNKVPVIFLLRSMCSNMVKEFDASNLI